MTPSKVVSPVTIDLAVSGDSIVKGCPGVSRSIVRKHFYILQSRKMITDHLASLRYNGASALCFCHPGRYPPGIS